MRIGLDVDGVLADFNRGFADLAAGITGHPVQWLPGGPYTHHWEHDEAKLTVQEATACWDAIRVSRRFWYELDPLPGAVAALSSLNVHAEGGDEVYFLTIRPGFAAGLQTAEWLERAGAILPTILICSNADDKANLAFDLRLDAYLDDTPENCRVMWSLAGMDATLLTQPWNAADNWWNRATSVSEFLEKYDEV